MLPVELAERDLILLLPLLLLLFLLSDRARVELGVKIEAETGSTLLQSCRRSS